MRAGCRVKTQIHPHQLARALHRPAGTSPYHALRRPMHAGRQYTIYILDHQRSTERDVQYTIYTGWLRLWTFRPRTAPPSSRRSTRRWTRPPRPPPANYVLVKDTNGDNKITLAIRSDNLYVCGFQNSYGEWFTFQGLVYFQKILQNMNSSTLFVFDKYCPIMD